MGVGGTRRQLLLTTTMLAGALTGYGGRAYAACANSGGSTYQCSGANVTQQSITLVDDADVSTVPGFSVVTGDPRAISITGDGALFYTDTYSSPLTGATTALYIRSNGDVGGGNPGSVTVTTDGVLIGGTFGIYTRNYGSGALAVTANGDVTGFDGIVARNRGTDLTVTTGAGTTVTGGPLGI